jgi:hypothetical protein
MRGGDENSYKIPVGQCVRNRALCTPRGRLKDDIKIDLRKAGTRVWTAFIWLRKGTVVDRCEHRRGPSGSKQGGNFLTSLAGRVK